jgi:ABC-type multidrug transport system ATPase subunit
MATSGHAMVDIDGTEAGGGTPMRPPVPYVLDFKDLPYSVKKRREPGCLPSCPNNRLASADTPTSHAGNMKTLLDGISGEAQDRELFGVMGASGSGKSTLLDVLAGQCDAQQQAADAGRPASPDAHHARDAAEFRLPRLLPTDRKRARMDALVNQLGLARTAETIICDEGHRGVSGDERRHMLIGTNIIHDPILLFLNEPTSGLDSASTFMVVQVLRHIARSGSVVVMTIHQSNARILSMLDGNSSDAKGIEDIERML